MKYVPSPVIALALFPMAAQAAVTVSDYSTLWTPFLGNYDYLSDQQTGQTQGDIVGNGTDYGFLMAFNDNGSASSTDGELLFRVRFDSAGGTTELPAFDRVVWIGIDSNGDGSIDAFVGLNRQGASSEIGVYEPGDGTNTSPSTTSIDSTSTSNIIAATSSSNYNYRPVNFANDGGTTNDLTTASSGDPDYYVSFMIPFADVVSFLAGKSIAITDQSAMRYISATSTQVNALNQDLGGVEGGTKSTSTWSALGAFTPSVALVPEPSSGLLALGTMALAVLRRRR